jgi:hypothetical protein
MVRKTMIRPRNRTALLACGTLVLTVGSLAASVSVAQAQQTFVYPAQGQSQEQQNRDHGDCHVWAIQQSGFDPANPQVAGGAPPPQSESQQGGVGRGAVRGGVVGLGVGAIAGDAGKGAAIGAVGGGLIGGMRRNDQRRRQAQQQQDYQQQQQAALNQGRSNYNRAFSVCMQGRGYTVQ